MRARVSVILSEEILAKIDAIAVEKQKRSTVIEQALREFVAREESKQTANSAVETSGQKTAA